MPDNNSVTELTFYFTSGLSVIFFCLLILRQQTSKLGPIFLAAVTMQAIFLAGVAYIDPFDVPLNQLHTSTDISLLWALESSHYAAWLCALIFTAQRHCKNCLPPALKIICLGLILLVPITAISNCFSPQLKPVQFHAMQWTTIAFSVFSFLLLEQLYRNLTHDRLLRLICLGLGLTFVFDAFLYAHNLINFELNQGLWQVRASIILVSTIFIVLGLIAMKDNARERAVLSFSQPAVFYTTSLSISGVLLLLLAVGGYYVKFNNTNWATVIYASLSAAIVISMALIFSSNKLRQMLNVFINKHLFSYKYDYRSEWLKLIRLLSQPTEHMHSGKRAISAATNLFRCQGGALWLKRGRHFVAIDQAGSFESSKVRDEMITSDFSQTLSSGWIFTPNTKDAEMMRHNEIVPAWINDISEIWLIFPLLVEDDITGFIILSHPISNTRPNWEDLDLVKTVSRQIANYLARHEQSELLAQAKQFETFNKLSAFVMHDLKNLIAQQSLVVKNAEKHKDNPAFVEDAINTINNSVERMNTLLRKLKQNEPEQTRAIGLKDLLLDAVRRCQKNQPVPTLSPIDDDIIIKADFDSLVMVFTHLIHNAQDATPPKGFIDVYAERDNNLVKVFIEDNGEGMTEKFMRDKLFRPFESTKAGKGMGVGVFQAKEYIESLGGSIEVTSSPEQGTTFTLSIPTA